MCFKSSSSSQLEIRRTRLTVGDRAFPVAPWKPTVEQSAQRRHISPEPQTLAVFRKRVKIFFFSALLPVLTVSRTLTCNSVQWFSSYLLRPQSK